MSFTTGSQKSVKLGEKRSYFRFAAPETTDHGPTCYLPNSFRETVRKGLNTDQPSHHESTHGRIDERLAGRAQPLIIFAHPPVLREPREGSLHYPAPRQNLKASTREEFLPIDLPTLLGPFLCPDPGYLFRCRLRRTMYDLHP